MLMRRFLNSNFSSGRPVISQPFRVDPIEDVIKTEGDKGIRRVRDVLRPLEASASQPKL